jgi:hypothetical protein
MSIITLALVVATQSIGPAAGHTSLDCAYAPRATGELSTFSLCAWKDAKGKVHFSRWHLKRMDFDGHGLASVYVGGWRYVARNGRSAAVLTFDNGPDPFADGLARYQDGKKIGYIDRKLVTIIPARFDGGYPFENRRAVICNGCGTVLDGDYSSYINGSWGCIDRRGRFVVALRSTRDHAPCSRPRE